MTTIAALDVKNKWFNLLERVVQGEYITILNHGVAVAELVPVTSKRSVKATMAIAKLKQFQDVHTLGGFDTTNLNRRGT